MKMKNMKEASVELSFFTWKNVKNWEVGEQILTTLNMHGENIAPEFVDFGKGWQSLSIMGYDALKEIWTNSNNLLFIRESKYRCQLALMLDGLTVRVKPITLWMDEDWFSTLEQIQLFIAISKVLYEIIQPEFGFIHKTDDKIKMATFHHPKLGNTVLPINLNKGIPGIYWANFYGPNIIKSIGKDRLLSASWYRYENLSDGGLFSLTGSSPVSDSPSRYIQRKLERELGEKQFYNVDNNDL
jgi:hypothetical protein